MNEQDKQDIEDQLLYLEDRKPKRGEIVHFLNFSCKVCPLARPRKAAAGHIYQPKDNQRSLLYEVMQERSLIKPTPKPIDYPVIVDHFIQFTKCKTCKSKFAVERHLGDYDNLCKAINDALVVGKFLKDDNIIVEGETCKFYDTDNDAIDFATIVIYKAVLEDKDE